MGTCNSFNVPSGCHNPCKISQSNTAACESLPSQIQNFTDQFFGAVVKTEIDGVVSWSLPCGLDVGLPNNPRMENEGLACYFLRLFEQGIVGFTGPQGKPGANGANGNNAFTVTLHSFVQPTLSSPNVTVQTSYNPSILPGLYVAIATSGWYLVNAADTSGVLFLTLVKSFEGATGTITAGKLVVPSGFPGESITGPQGPQGPKGDTGTPGESFSATNGIYYAPIGTNYDIQVVDTAVDFTNSAPQVLLPSAGTYLLTAVVDVVGLAGITDADSVTFKLRDTTVNGDLAGSSHIISKLAVDERKQAVIVVTWITINPNETVALFAKASSANVFAAVALNTTMTFVRLA